MGPVLVPVGIDESRLAGIAAGTSVCVYDPFVHSQTQPGGAGCRCDMVERWPHALVSHLDGAPGPLGILHRDIC